MKAISSLATLSLALLLSSCSLMQKAAPAPADEPAATQKDGDKDKQEATMAEAKDTTPAPTEEQQKAAAQLIEGVSDIDYTPEYAAELRSRATEAPAATPSALPSGGLRMGSIIPQEDPASTGDAPAPTANAAERFGLRSPKMPGKLPMGIDGKIQNAQ